jgi:hypothetical protein
VRPAEGAGAAGEEVDCDSWSCCGIGLDLDLDLAVGDRVGCDGEGGRMIVDDEGEEQGRIRRLDRMADAAVEVVVDSREGHVKGRSLRVEAGRRRDRPEEAAVVGGSRVEGSVVVGGTADVFEEGEEGIADGEEERRRGRGSQRVVEVACRRTWGRGASSSAAAAVGEGGSSSAWASSCG